MLLSYEIIIYKVLMYLFFFGWRYISVTKVRVCNLINMFIGGIANYVDYQFIILRVWVWKLCKTFYEKFEEETI